MRKHRLILAVLLVSALLLSACGAEAPKPLDNTVEYAQNSSGRRFSFTLNTLTAGINRTLAANTPEAEEPETVREWSILSRGLVDSSGIAYTSYCVRGERFTLTAAVEDDSERVMNLGCGCARDSLADEKERRMFLALTAVLAVQAGGFADDDVPFLQRLIETLLEGEADELYYERVRYSRSEDRDTVVVILSPCSAAQARRDGVKTYQP